jgi:hypothetical protein
MFSFAKDWPGSILLNATRIPNINNVDQCCGSGPKPDPDPSSQHRPDWIQILLSKIYQSISSLLNL